MNIPFNKPYMTGKETDYIREAVSNGKISGNGVFTQKCQTFFEKRYGFKKCLLTTSCTDALEMAAILTNVGPGDEVVIPSYTFVSTALAFVRQGATIIFADSTAHHPNMDADKLEELITPRTKVIVPVHYAGVACDMDKIMSIAKKYDLYVVEDAAQAVDSSYFSKVHNNWLPLGGIGHIGCFSFHETKNIISGEGGMLAINDEQFSRRAEIIWEKGTNRSEFFRGEVNKYGWVDIGSSFLPSEIIAAFLWAQLEHLDTIQERRKEIWRNYYSELSPFSNRRDIKFPIIPEYATNNAHMFYLILPDLKARSTYIDELRSRGVQAVFHYLSLHASDFYRNRHDGRSLANCEHFADCLVRLPFFYELDEGLVIKSMKGVLL